MSDVNNKDHWRELADILGLPPDDNPPPAKPAPEPPPPALRPEPEPAPPAAEVRELPTEDLGIEQSVEPMEYEEIVITETVYVQEQVDEPAEPRRVESEGISDEDTTQERPRRGRRRGRRGHRGDAPERDDNRGGAHRERARVEEGREPAGEASPEEVRDEGEQEPREVRGEVRDHAERDREDREREERGRGERGGRGRRRRPAESRRREVEEDEDLLEPEEAEVSEVAEPSEAALEEEDNEEVDELKDLNLPSWTELISSLYRPER